MTAKKIFGLSLFAFFFIRIFSFLFTPATPLWAPNLINSIFSVLVLIATIYLLIKKDIRGWYIIAAEIILGGSGSYFGVGLFSLRTLLLLASVLIFFCQKIFNKEITQIFKNKFSWAILALLIWSGISALIGIKNGHAVGSVFADTIPYLFLAYYFPLKEIVARDSNFINNLKNILIAALIGNFVIIIFTFCGFSSNLFALQDHYYHWYRDVAAGKITSLPFSFYRLVLNEHLVLVPILLALMSELLQGKNKKINWSLSILIILVLAINLTRIYYLALAGGILLLFHKDYWKNWIKYSLAFLLILITSFSVIHLGASRGQSLGWEIFGLRLQSIASPQIEGSSLSRMIRLPKILEKITDAPILGQGLGDTITVYSPTLKETITTPHFDWGYLEILAEMGIIGLIIWLTLIFFVLRYTQPKNVILPIVGALLIINLTSPALFHVFGILTIVLLLSTKQVYGKH